MVGKKAAGLGRPAGVREESERYCSAPVVAALAQGGPEPRDLDMALAASVAGSGQDSYATVISALPGSP